MKYYPVLTFDIVEDKNRYKQLESFIKIGKSNDEYKKNCHEWYIKSYMRLVRNTISECNDEKIKKHINNYMSVFLKEGNIVGVIIYDVIKDNLDDIAKVKYEKREDGRFYPYIEIYK